MEWYTHNAAHTAVAMALALLFVLWCVMSSARDTLGWWLATVGVYAHLLSVSIQWGLYAAVLVLLCALWARGALLRTYAALLYLATRVVAGSRPSSSSNPWVQDMLGVVCGVCTCDIALHLGYR